ncbi:MAG: hypothetical protein Q9160_007586 [Pyrenula sp. 1 TL-2023]
MTSFLIECGARVLRPSFVTDYVYRKDTQKYRENIQLMRDVANQVIERRRTDSSRKKDLVDAMIHEKDPKSGKALPESSIINNMITFLIAGNFDTTFIAKNIVNSWQAMRLRRARGEVLSVLGNGVMTAGMISKLPYVSAVIRETLRLHPTAPGFTVHPLSSDSGDYPMLIGQKKYPINQYDTIHALLPHIHRDPTVFGDDAEEFRPERMLDEHFNKLPKSSWKPFGSGMRGCIGRAFALQEATIIVALLLQNFDFELYDSEYQLSVRKTLTVKPKDLSVRARLREGLSLTELQRRLLGGQMPDPSKVLGPVVKHERLTNASGALLKDLLICYGSNTGTCQTLAFQLAQVAQSQGFSSTVISMDEATLKIKPETPLVIITASYEGNPPDNAVKFVAWLERLTESPFAGCHHAVFGCGNRDWVDTFQRIPKIVDDALVRLCSRPLVARGVSDAADNNIFNEFDYWADNLLWPALAKQYITFARNANEQRQTYFDVIQSSRISKLLQDGSEATIQQWAVLTSPDQPEKRHIKIQLPRRLTYTVGDYLAVLPVNHDEIIKEILRRFELPIDSKLVAENGSETSAYTFLREHVELSQVATEKNIRTILQSTPDKSSRESLESISTGTITSQRLSVLDLLRQFPTSNLSFSEYLAMLPPLRPRQYSISSSPTAAGSNNCTLTYSVLNGQNPSPHANSHPKRLPVAHTAAPEKKPSHLGVASNYLASLRPNDRLWVAIRPGHGAFRTTAKDLTQQPIVLVCAGSGIAPFRGFVQERAKLLAEKGNDKPGISASVARDAAADMVLFIGCRHPERDALYARELASWAEMGVLRVKWAFSRAPERSEGCKYVQERVWNERKSKGSGLVDLLVKGEGEGEGEGGEKGKGKMFVCGSRKMAEGVEKMVVKACAEEKGWGLKEAEKWFRKVRSEGRFVVEAFD